MEYDLHTHTTASDGTLSPGELVVLAKKSGLKGFAITDHDTVGGLREGIAWGREHNVEVLPGVELSTYFGDYEVHILGYLIDWETEGLKSALSALSRQRFNRARQMVSKLQQLGFPLDFSEVQSIAGKGVIGRPHLAAAMVKHGYVTDVKEAFTRFLGKGAPAYVARKRLTLEEGVRLINCAKGIPVLAHPGLLGNLQIIPLLIDHGLMGIEVFYPEHTPAQTEYYLKLCRNYGLIPTGGSDFHGTIKEAGIGNCGVNQEVVQRLKKKQEECHG